MNFFYNETVIKYVKINIKSIHGNIEQFFNQSNSSTIGLSLSGVIFNLVNLLTNEWTLPLPNIVYCQKNTKICP